MYLQNTVVNEYLNKLPYRAQDIFQFPYCKSQKTQGRMFEC